MPDNEEKDIGIGSLLDMASDFFDKTTADPVKKTCDKCKQEGGQLLYVCPCGHTESICLACTMEDGMKGMRRLLSMLMNHESSCCQLSVAVIAVSQRTEG